MDWSRKLRQQLIVMVLGIAAFSIQSEGACIFQGSLFANNTEWKPESCQHCTCHDSVVVCEKTLCRDPQCDFTKGEIFQIDPNKCCPECASRSEDFCLHEGKEHAHETQWAPSKCILCTCMHGKVTCASKPCPRISCRAGEIEVDSSEKCCPKCVGTGESCSLDGGLILKDGEELKLGQCSKCTCKNGVTQCLTADCVPVLCDKDEMLAAVPGKCCPECLPKSCAASGKTYEHGSQWKKNPCTTCICDRGEVNCHTKTCPTLSCGEGQRKLRRSGQCCEECLFSKGNCMVDGSIKYHGELWNGSRCEFCLCDRGKVLCYPAQCSHVACSWGEELVHFEGKCCAECVLSTSYCLYKDYGKEDSLSDFSGVKRFMDGEKWREDECTECECQNGQVTCFSPSCPSCPVGTLAVNEAGECCPQCKQEQCNPDCLTCSQSIDHCDICRDEARLLQMGRCVYSCDPGFYLDGRTCLACKETCVTCNNGFECTACVGSLLLKEGKCVASCGPGYFQGYLDCSACHESCSECHGPSESDCITCKGPLQVKHGGHCADSCGSGFYLQNGTCSDCDPSCQTCYSENRCLSCAKGRIFYHGRCVLHCPASYYSDSDGVCIACHKDCASCSGTLANQCTSCSPPLALLKGQCISHCVIGYYFDGNHCSVCHPSCRICLGPEDSHCTQCTDPEHSLQAVQEYRGKPFGSCVPQCAQHFYMDTTGICQECHFSCGSCIGKNHLNCTDCTASNVLHYGACLPQCPEGFFGKDAACHTCHPSCKECSGSSDAHCLTCHPHATLTAGICKTSCPDGQYLNLVGYCVDCHSQCQYCVANLHDTGSVCLKCQYSRYNFFGDHCLPECPAGFYVEGRTCKGCHLSCKTCSGPGLNLCTSCEDGLVLFHNGMCTQSCYQGYYRDGNVCKACNNECLTCDSVEGCTACKDPKKVLLFGECQYESCTQQYYLDYTSGTCKECDWSCNACKGPLNTDCLQCMEHYSLHYGACVEHCPPSYYKHGDTCRECGIHCQFCVELNNCSQCKAPFYLLDGQCVKECSQQQHVSHSDRKCTSCPSGCLECDSSQHCKKCDNRTFLRNHLCVNHCGHGFTGNTTSRRCEANTHPPVLLVNGSFTVGIGAVRPLDLSFMSVKDLDTKEGSLTFHVVTVPANGRLVKIAHGKEVHLNKDTYFSWKDLIEQRVRFKHSKEKSRKGFFSLKVSDGQLYSQPKTIHIQAVSTKAPYILKNEHLVVGKGEVGSITSSVLDLRDDDNPQDVTFIVLTSPKYGQLVIPPGNTPIHKFRLDDITNGALHYIHDGSESQSDVIVFQANDGYYFQNILFHVKITEKTNSGIQLVLNSAVWVPEGGMLQISNRLLQARAFGVADSDILYTTIASEHPHFGWREMERR